MFRKKNLSRNTVNKVQDEILQRNSWITEHQILQVQQLLNIL